MDRRAFLTAKKKTQPVAVVKPKPVAGRTTSDLTIYTGAWTKTEVTHLLKRTMFGSRLSDISYFAAKTMSEAVDELLNPVDPLPAPPVKEYDGVTGVTTPDNDVANGTTWVNNVNKHRHDPVGLETTWKTKWWPNRQFTFLLSISEVNAGQARARARDNKPDPTLIF